MGRSMQLSPVSDGAGAAEPMVCVAAVAAAHGVRGALKLKSFTEVPQSCTEYGPVHDEQGRKLFELRLVAIAKGVVIAKADGIEDRDTAEALRGLRLYVPRSRLPAAEEEEFYHADLIGMDAVDPDGRSIGRVAAVLNFGAGDLLEIARSGQEPMVLPFTRAIVPEIELAARRLTLVVPDSIETEEAA